jgi:hypothetical protein
MKHVLQVCDTSFTQEGGWNASPNADLVREEAQAHVVIEVLGQKYRDDVLPWCERDIDVALAALAPGVFSDGFKRGFLGWVQFLHVPFTLFSALIDLTDC